MNTKQITPSEKFSSQGGITKALGSTIGTGLRDTLNSVNEHKQQILMEEVQDTRAKARIERIRNILEKPAGRRTNDELSELSDLISQIEFFKNKSIKEKDMQELCMAFSFEKFDAKVDVFKWGEPGDTFYIIIKGIVSVRIPNQKIKGWRIQRMEYNKLKEYVAYL